MYFKYVKSSFKVWINILGWVNATYSLAQRTLSPRGSGLTGWCFDWQSVTTNHLSTRLFYNGSFPFRPMRGGQRRGVAMVNATFLCRLWSLNACIGGRWQMTAVNKGHWSSNTLRKTTKARRRVKRRAQSTSKCHFTLTVNNYCHLLWMTRLVL